MINCDDVSFYKVSKIVDKLLGWDEKFEHMKKRELRRAKKYRYNQSYDISNHAEIVLGECFIELFHKLYKERANIDREEMLNEMQFLFDYVRNSVNTNGKVPLLDGDLRDRFLTAGAYPEYFVNMNRAEIVAYDKFLTNLLFYKSVSKAYELIEIK